MLDHGSLEKNPPKKKKKTRMTAAWASVELGLGAIGVLLVVLGALIGRHWENKVDKKFQQEMVLSATSEGVEEWISPTVPIISNIFFWNWTNPGDIAQPGYKPVMQEVGPYTFREKHKKVNVTWNSNGTVTYRLVKLWHFDAELSAGELTDNITSVNVIAATLSTMSSKWTLFARRMISMGLITQRQKVSWTKSVAELTFEGFRNPIQSLGSYLSDKAKDRFGYFYGVNGTVSTDIYTIYTGENNIYQIGDVHLYNFQNSTTAHEGLCERYRGSMGELWAPHRTSQSVLTMFTPDMCRSISYYYEKKGRHNGIPSLIYSSTNKTVDNGTLVPDNSCYCPKSGCEPAGLWDLRSCREGAPVFMSLPHLYLADPVYRNAVEGLKPNASKHKFFIELEPRTGVPFKVAARLQLNVKLTKNHAISLFRDVEDVLVPVWWMETVVSLPESHTAGVKLLLWIIYLGPFIAGSFIFIGAVLIMFLTFRRYLYKCRSKMKRRKRNIIEAEKSSMTLISRNEPSLPVSNEEESNLSSPDS